MKKLQDILMWSFVAICPIAWTTVVPDLRLFQEQVYKFAAMILVVAFCRNLWLALFFYLAIALWILNDCAIGHTVILNIFLGIVLFTCSRAYFKHNDFLKVARFLYIPLTISLIWMVFQHFGIDPLNVNNPLQGDTVFRTFTDPIGLFGSKSHNAIFLAIMIPIVAAWRWYIAPLLFIPMYFCDSSAAFAAGILAYLLILFFHHRKLCLIAMPILLISLLIYVGIKDMGQQGRSLSMRFPMWHATFKMSLDRPIGYGPGTFNHITKHKQFKFFTDDNQFMVGWYLGKHDGMEDYDVKPYHPNFYKMHKETPIQTVSNPVGWNNPHNLFLSLLSDFGVLGVLLFILLMREIYLRFIHSWKPLEVTVLGAILLVYLVTSTTQFPLYVARLACLAPIVLGAFFAKTEQS